MFILTGSAKEKIATAGTVISCLLFAFLSVRLAFDGGYALIFALLFLLVPLLVFKGLKAGYFMARLILGLLAITFILGSVNSFAYEDVMLAKGSYPHFVIKMVALGAVPAILWYCVGEHARLRRLMSGERTVATDGVSVTENPTLWKKIRLLVILIVVMVVLSLPGLLIMRSIMSRPITAVTKSNVIATFMDLYAQHHQGVYPTGKSSTEIFQKLIDGGYISPTSVDLFYEKSFRIPGKSLATSKVLKPENVCWDVTAPLDDKSSDFVPVVFSTGYRINYIPSGSAVPLFPSSENRLPGIVASLKNAYFPPNAGQPDGVVTNFISPHFVPGDKKYQQLTPDGPLAP